MAWTEPGEERRRLTEAYREKWDDELRALAEEFNDLTAMAQEVLREEMRQRGLGAPGAPVEASAPGANAAAAIHWEAPPRRFDGPAVDEAADAPDEFTWKTHLCDCETSEQAWQLGEALRRAGIDSWIEGAGRYAWDVGGPRILVAADQLEQARAIAAQPIPQEIIDASKAELTEPEPFELPVCPTCGADDPVLENADPVNTWRCESCGREWTDSEATPLPGD